MIKSITLENFGCHKHLHIDFCDKINVIVGQTNIGKSTIFKAIRLLFNNKPSNSKKIFDREQKHNFLISAIVNNYKIDRTSKEYVLTNLETNSVERFSTFGVSVPQPILNVLNLSDINYQRQMDQYFLLLDTPGQRAKSLSPTIGIDDSNRLIDHIKGKISNTKSDIKVNKKRKLDLLQECDRLRKSNVFLGRLTSLKFRKNELAFMERKVNEIIKIIESIKKLNIINIDEIPSYISETSKLIKTHDDIIKTKRQIIELRKIVENFSKLKPAVKTTVFTQLISNILELIEYDKENQGNLLIIEQISKLIKNLKKVEVQLSESKSKLRNWNSLFEKKMKESGTCPLCDQKIKNF